MRIKIFNLNLGGYRDWTDRCLKVIQALNEQGPDVVLLQEVIFDLEHGSYDQAALLNKRLTEPYQFSTSSISKFYTTSTGRTYREGLAVLSRHPIVRSEVIALTKRLDDKHVRFMQNADIEILGSEVKLTNIHLSNNQYSPEQFGEVLGILKARGEPRIIAGDFNMEDLSSVRPIFEANYAVSTDFASYVSFPEKNLTLDYVLLPENDSFVHLETFKGLSDHAALCITVEVNRS